MKKNITEQLCVFGSVRAFDRLACTGASTGRV